MLQQAAFLSASVAVPGCFAEELTQGPVRTASMVEGPFYPDKLPLDTDNDLLLINDSINPGVGEVTYLSGRVMGKSGKPLRNAFVEIWQCDQGGAYLHSGSSNKAKSDANFQGYGRYLTDNEGRYFFRTIKPVPYPGRTPHIHFGVSRNGHRVLTTQMLVKGHPMNREDFCSNESPIRPPEIRCSLDSIRSRDQGLASWRRVSISCSEKRSRNLMTEASAVDLPNRIVPEAEADKVVAVLN